MALGTSYKRNVDRAEKRIEARIVLAQSFAKDFERDLHLEPAQALDLGAKVVMGRLSADDVYRSFGKL